MEFADTRYNRQELMPQMGPQGQKKLRDARVICIGAGGVKSPMLYYLAAAGVGTLRVVDFDHVELSNLNRQILYSLDDIGKNRAMAARDRLTRLNDSISIEVGKPIVDGYLTFSGFQGVFDFIPAPRRPGCPACGGALS